jgi:hypothetical protein
MKNRRHRKLLTDPSKITALDPDEFLAAHQYAGMVMENELLEEVPGIGKPFIRTPDGELLGFSKEPTNLFAMAVLRHFRVRGEPEKFQIFMHRFSALLRLLNHDQMKQYQRRGNDGSEELNGAVFEVVATQKLNKNWEFDAESFFRKVREVAVRMQADGPTC